MQKTLIISQGEPAGIGAEIITKAVALYEGDADILILGDQRCFPDLQQTHKIKFQNYHFPDTTLKIPNSVNASVILNLLTDGIKLCLKNPQQTALVTAPLQKQNITPYHPHFKGHTEFLSEVILQETGIYYPPVMMLSGLDLKVIPLTVHIPLMDVKKHLIFPHFEKTVQIIMQELRLKYGIQTPHLVVAGLNPHAGDEGVMGTEEQDFLTDWIKRLAQTYHVTGPYAADSLFHAKARRQYDAALCLYHDQALIPVKTLAFDTGVNITLGLPIVRTSPDHGTALGIAGQNKACPQAMLAAMLEAEKLLNSLNNG